MDRIERLRIFTRVAECRSFTRAAELLGIPRSTVSTAIKALERQLETRLLHRTTRQVSPTPDGSAFYQRCLRLIEDFDETESFSRHEIARPRGRIRISAPGRIARRIIVPGLPEFFDRFPEIEIDIGATDRSVDLLGEGVDCAIRVGQAGGANLISQKIGELELLNCGSPEYLRAHGTPASPDELAGHYAVSYFSAITDRSEDWEYMDGNELKFIKLKSRVTVDNAEAYIEASVAGLGLIQVPAFDVADEMAAGRLVEVMSDYRPATMPLTFVYPYRRQMSRRVHAFIDWAIELLRSEILDLAQK